MGKIKAVFETDGECTYDNSEPKKGKFTAVFETDAECECHCNDDYIPNSFAECETVDMKLNYFNEQIDSIDINATAEVNNDGGEPEVIVTKTGDNHLKPTFDFAFKNVIGRQGEQGEDGFSPIISVTDITGGHRVSITDAEGTETFDVMDGQDGQNGQDGQDGQSATIQVGTVTTGAAGSDASVTNSGTSSAAVFDFTIPRGNTGESGQDGNDGFSPVITVTDITGGHRVSITDATGTQTFDVMDGEGRVPAITASASVDTNVGTPSVTVTKTGTDVTPNFAFAFSNLKGQAGQNGQNGQDGISPTVTVRDITGGHQIEIVSAGGTERFDVMDGQDGSDGQAATIQVGTVTTGAAGSSASVNNSGTSSAAVFNFTIPRGDTGAAGQNGQDGVTPVISATAEVDANTGTPSVTVTKSGTDAAPNFDFAFKNLKGDTGASGQNGQDGVTPVISATAEVDTNTGTPSVTVTKSGTDAAPNFDFAFNNLKGDTGATGPQGPAGTTPVISATATVGANTGTPSVTVTKSGTDAAPSFAFAFDGLKGEGGGNDEFWNVAKSVSIFDSSWNTVAVNVRKVEGSESDYIYIGFNIGNSIFNSARYTPTQTTPSLLFSKEVDDAVSIEDGIARSLILPSTMGDPSTSTWSYYGTTTLENATFAACLKALLAEVGIDFSDYSDFYPANDPNMADAYGSASLPTTPQAYMEYSDYYTPVYYETVSRVDIRNNSAESSIDMYYPNSECTSSTYSGAWIKKYMSIYSIQCNKS